jgi:tetratricopeptide (TPR) repeat protein
MGAARQSICGMAYFRLSNDRCPTRGGFVAAALEQAGVLAQAAQDGPREEKWRGQLGRGHLLRGRLDRSITSYEQALVIVCEDNQRATEVNILGASGKLYEDGGKDSRAREHLQLALRLARRLKDLRREVELAGNFEGQGVMSHVN